MPCGTQVVFIQKGLMTGKITKQVTPKRDISEQQLRTKVQDPKNP